MPQWPNVTFGIIVLNGEPFTRYCLRALYPYAHQLIVVEGAAPAAAQIATPDGHSTDGTLEALYRFQREEDPEHKVEVVTRDGFWSEKDEMSQAYAARATGDYLWQVDIDEFYRPEDMARVLERLRDDPTLTAVSFKQLTFWGGLEYRVDGWYLRAGADIYHRLFRWGEGFTYTTHRPPTVTDASGRDLRARNPLTAHALARQGIYLYHYSLLLPKQVQEKCAYYGHAPWAHLARAERWAHETFLALRHPYRVHNRYDYPSWLDRFAGAPPPAIVEMVDDLRAGRLSTALRHTDDIERVLASPAYQCGRACLQRLSPISPLLDFPRRAWRKVLRLLARPAPGEHPARARSGSADRK